MNLPLRFFAVLLTLGSCLAARADLFTFAFSGQGQSAAGSLVANSTGTPGQFLITSISGTLTGVTIAGLLAPGTFGGNDNLLLSNGGNYIPDAAGFSFGLIDGVQANVFTFTTPPFAGQQFLRRSDGSLSQMTSFQITPAPVPEPSSWMLLGTAALGMMGTVRRRFLA